MRQPELTFRAPPEVAEIARRALLARKRYGRGGTLIGVVRAYQLSQRRPMRLATIKRMVSFFARHGPDDRSSPSSAASIAWGLWGADRGRAWAKAIVARYS